MQPDSTDRAAASRSWGIAAIAFVGGVGGGVVFPILPVLGMDLGISGLMVGLILSANRITRLGFNPITGTLIDRFGARWPVAVGLAIEALGTLAFSAALRSTAPSAWFLLGRVIWGVGSSLLLVGVMAAVMSVARPERRGSMTARVRTAISLGLPAGLVIGGLVADRVSADAAFFTATGLSLLGAFAAALVLPGAIHREHERSQRTAGNSFEQWRGLLRIPTLRMIWAANGVLFFAVSGVLLASLAVLVKQRQLYVFNLSAEGSSGLYMAALMSARAGASLAVGRHLDRAASRTRLLLPATLLAAAGLIGLGQARSLTAVLVTLLAIGVGSGGLTIPLLTLLGDVTPRQLHGRALSIYQWTGDLGGAVGPPAGLEMGHAFGYSATYGAVGILALTLAATVGWIGLRGNPMNVNRP